MPSIEVVGNAKLNATPHVCNEQWAGLTKWRDASIQINADLSGASFECALAHELTHWLQVKNGVKFGDVETPAYHVEAMCLKLHFHMKEAAAERNRQQEAHAGGKCQG